MATYGGAAKIPTKDTFIFETGQTSNYSTFTYLAADRLTGGRARTVMEFSISDLPAGCNLNTITAAVVKLYFYSGSGMVGRTVNAIRGKVIGEALVESQITWLIPKNGSAWQLGGAGGGNDCDPTMGDGQVIPAVGNWVAWDMWKSAGASSILKYAIDNALGVITLLLYDAAEGGAAAAGYFYSKENASLRPYLEITYTPPPPTVTTQAATSVAATTVVMNGNVTDDGGLTVDYIGFVYEACASDQGDPGNVAPETQALYANYVKSDSGNYGTGAFVSGAETVDAITGLTSNTIYHGRACAHNSNGWSYGSDITFTTLFTHRISNADTQGIKAGGVAVQAKVYIIDMLEETMAGPITVGEDGYYEHDVYTAEDVIPKLVAVSVHDVKANLTTAQGSHKDLVFTAKATDATHWYPGGAGNALTIHYHHTGSLTISVAGAAITININAGTTTAAQIKTAIEADPDANKMVSVAYAAGQNGSGAPAAMDATNLVGGLYYTSTAHAFITPTEI